VFHAGTKATSAADDQAAVVTSGGRVLAVTAVSPTPSQAIDGAYAALDKIHFDGMHYRCDIGSYFANNTRTLASTHTHTLSLSSVAHSPHDTTRQH
jgi:phosphoribosylamine-glycine ligase